MGYPCEFDRLQGVQQTVERGAQAKKRSLNQMQLDRPLKVCRRAFDNLGQHKTIYVDCLSPRCSLAEYCSDLFETKEAGSLTHEPDNEGRIEQKMDSNGRKLWKDSCHRQAHDR